MEFCNAEFLQYAVAHQGSLISIWDRDRIGALHPRDEEVLAQIVAELGARSGRAQGLNGSITTLPRVRQRGQLLFIYSIQDGSTTRVTGFLKTGVLNLFLADARGTYEAVNACCVLDFYVCESCQRQGVGNALFTAALHHLSTAPEFLAYDRPSSKLVAFLAKHYGLVHGITQPNNFMIFRGFFQGNKRADRKQNANTVSQSVSLTASLPVHVKSPSIDPMACYRAQSSVVGNAHAGLAYSAAHHQAQKELHLDSKSLYSAEIQPTMNEIPASARGPVLQPDRDQWMLPQAIRTVNQEPYNTDPQTCSGKESCGRGSLPFVQHPEFRCAAGDVPARSAQTVPDPELKAALAPDTEIQGDGDSKVLSEGNQLCGLLFEDPKRSRSSGLQYTLGGNDSSYSHSQGSWLDQSGSERSIHQRYRRLRR